MDSKYRIVALNFVPENLPNFFDQLTELLREFVGDQTRVFTREIGEEIFRKGFLIVALENEDTVVGMLTLNILRKPTGRYGYIDDVVVLSRVRGEKLGEALMHIALDQAKKEGTEYVALTSHPSRIVANILYQKMGGKLRETNVYRFSV